MKTRKIDKLDYRLDNIPQNQCKLFDIEGQKVAVCHDPDDKFRFYELEPIGKKKVFV